MPGWQYGDGLIYLRSVFRPTKSQVAQAHYESPEQHYPT